jgi:glycosyltransferase involved in cell wall biosynthesis
MIPTKNNNLSNPRPLRIGIDGRVLQDLQPSGIPNYAKNIITEMLKIDNINQYIIFYNSFRKIDNRIPRFNGNVEERFFHYPNKFLEWFWKIISYPKVDQLLKLDAFFSPHFINIPLSKKVNKIVTIHDLSFIKNKKYFSFKKNIWHWQMNPRGACKSFDKIVAVSESTKKDIVNFYNINEKKIKVIYNGSKKIIDLISPEIQREFLFNHKIEKGKYILFLATLEPRKNIEGILDAFAKINTNNPDYKLVIAGKKGWLFNNIFKKTLNYKINDRIVFTDFVDEEQKHILFKNASIFIFPSFCEGFGIPLVEAMNYRLPIITSNTSSMPEIVKDVAILINPHNTEDLSIAISNILKNQNLTNILKTKCLKSHSLNWKDSAYQTLEYILS